MTNGVVHDELGVVLAGRKVGRENAEEIVEFFFAGSAIQDTAAAVAVYQPAEAKGIGTYICVYL